MLKSVVIDALSGAILFAVAASAADQAAKPADPQIAHIRLHGGKDRHRGGATGPEQFQEQGCPRLCPRMIGDHTAVNDQALALVKRLNVTPEDNSTSQNLTKEADAARNNLASLSRAGFDKAYIDNEVAYHKTVNTALSDTLIPDAQNADLKALLQKGLTLFQAHPRHAERLASQLQSASALQ